MAVAFLLKSSSELEFDALRNPFPLGKGCKTLHIDTTPKSGYLQPHNRNYRA
jgi:hypothetical protein